MRAVILSAPDRMCRPRGCPEGMLGGSASVYTHSDMQVSRRDAALAFAGLLLLAIAIVRVAVPDRLRLRALSVQGLDIDDEPLPSGDTITREKRWSPPTDIYLMGWQYRNGGSSAGSELSLLREPG